MAAEWFPPVLDAAESRVIEAWGALGGDRREALAQIPFTAIDRWAARRGIEGDEFDFIARGVRAADDAYLSWVAEQMPKADK